MFGFFLSLASVSVWGQGGGAGVPPATDDGWFFDSEDASAHLLTCGIM